MPVVKNVAVQQIIDDGSVGSGGGDGGGCGAAVI